MKSIIHTAIDLINKNKKGVSTEEIIKNIDSDEYSKQEISAIVYSDLIADGRFFDNEGKWFLKDDFTIKDINKIRSQHIIDELLYNEHDDLEITEDEVAEVGDDYEETEIDVHEIVADDNFDEEGHLDD